MKLYRLPCQFCGEFTFSLPVVNKHTYECSCPRCLKVTRILFDEDERKLLLAPEPEKDSPGVTD